MELFTFIVSIVIISLLGFYILWRLFSYFLILVIESLRKKKHQGNSSIKKQIKNENNKKSCGLGRLFFRFYDGLYRQYCKHISQIPSSILRKFVYKTAFRMKIGKKVTIHRGLEIRGGFNICIGDGTIIGDDCILDGRGGLNIGSNVNFSSRASVYTGQHSVNDDNFSYEIGSVEIKNRAWISSNSVVLPGVVVGEGAVLAAGGVATKNLDSFTINGGVPAKKIGDRNPNIAYAFNEKGIWFN